MKFGTKAIHAGLEADPVTGAIMTPVYLTSTYVQAAPGKHKGFEYSRTANPTRSALERNLAALENGKHALCFASGMAAIDTILKLLKPGDEVVSTNDLYGGTYRIYTKVFAAYGINFTFTGMRKAADIERHITGKTRLIWVETPTNPLMQIIDIAAVAALARKHRCLLAVDNTFATPCLQTPLDLGADIVMHSVTKYLGGHSDLVMGAVVCNDTALHERMHFLQNSTGGVPGPMDCFLALRGIKTLHLRMQRHCENGEALARYLAGHKAVDKVHWPGLKSHPGHDVARRQMRGFGGMISFTLKDNRMNRALKLISSTRLFSLAESLGGVESLIGHPASMTHASIPRAEREKAGLADSLIRLSVGIEDAEDLIADLGGAIRKVVSRK